MVFHAVVLVLATGFWRRPAKEDPRETHLAEDPGRAVRMVFLPPPPSARRPEAPPRPVPTPAPPSEPEPRGQPAPETATALAPPPPAPAEAETPTTRPIPIPAETGEPVPPPAATPPPTHTAEAPTLESEARRLFGPPAPARPPADSGGASGAASPFRPWRPAYADRSDCPPEPPPTDSAGRAALGTVTGQVFSSGDHHPLAGAYLQIIGTPYATFTDGNGQYRLTFDASLVANCRTQYVRVTAKGFEGRMLILAAGRNFQSDDVLLGRR